MKTFFLHSGRILLATFILMVAWMISLQVAENIIPGNLATEQAPEGLFFVRFLIVCLIHVVLLYVTVRRSAWTGLKLTAIIFILIFGIQYFLSMIEALWFNSSLAIPEEGIMSIFLSGLLLSLVFSPVLVWLSGKWRPVDQQSSEARDRNPGREKELRQQLFSKELAWKVPLLVLIIYPALYFIAGYYIAWQSEAVRLFYTGSTELEGFFNIMADNMENGLYFFQIPRGLIWTAIAIPLYLMLKGSYWFKAILTGLLFALLMNAQHLLPNPYFPEEVTNAHFIETASSNFLWGILIILVFHFPGLSRGQAETESFWDPAEKASTNRLHMEKV